MKFIPLLLLTCTLLLMNCDAEEEQSCFTCTYEKRKTGCNSSNYGAWESGSATVDFELKEGITPESHCKSAYPSSDLHCSSTCCVSFQFRNVEVGPC